MGRRVPLFHVMCLVAGQRAVVCQALFLVLHRAESCLSVTSGWYYRQDVVPVYWAPDNVCFVMFLWMGIHEIGVCRTVLSALRQISALKSVSPAFFVLALLR